MLTVSDITKHILRCDARLEELVEEITKAAETAAAAEATFRTRFAQERLKARADAGERKLTTDVAEDKATVATSMERLDYLVSANNLTVLRETLKATQSRMDAMRTLSASVRGAGG